MSSLSWVLKNVSLDAISDYEHNPREMTAAQGKELKKSIDKFGLIDKPVVNQNLKLIGGHQRVRLLRESGINDCDVWFPSRPLTDSEVRELNIRHNANTGQWNIELLMQDFGLQELKDFGFDHPKFNLAFDTLNEVMKQPICGNNPNSADVPAAGDSSGKTSYFDGHSHNQTSDNVTPYSPKKSDSEYSEIQIVVLHDTKLKFFEFLNAVRTKYGKQSIAEAMEYIVNNLITI